MKTFRITLLAALALAVAVPATSPAVIPPKECGTVKAGGKKHRIKADGVKCRYAKRKGKRYLRRGIEPGKAWKCRTYPSSSAFSFKCDRGTRKAIFGIRKN